MNSFIMTHLPSLRSITDFYFYLLLPSLYSFIWTNEMLQFIFINFSQKWHLEQSGKSFFLLFEGHSCDQNMVKTSVFEWFKISQHELDKHL